MSKFLALLLSVLAVACGPTSPDDVSVSLLANEVRGGCELIASSVNDESPETLRVSAIVSAPSYRVLAELVDLNDGRTLLMLDLGTHLGPRVDTTIDYVPPRDSRWRFDGPVVDYGFRLAIEANGQRYESGTCAVVH